MGGKYRQSIERLRERIDESDEISSTDADVLHRYTREVDSLGPAEIKDSTHEKYLMRLVTTAKEIGGLAAALEEKQVAKEINSWFRGHYPNPESNKTARDSGVLVRNHSHHPQLPSDVAEKARLSALHLGTNASQRV